MAKTKQGDKQQVGRKLVSLLKKHYKETPPKEERPVLETMLYAVCLENVSHDEAEAAYERLHESFHDLNEARVSSITELMQVFRDLPDPELRALRVRSSLQYVFESEYNFNFDSLKKKTLEQAVKKLGKLKELSPFVRNYTLQSALGSHLVPVDERMTRAAKWLGLLDNPEETPESAAESLKSAVRKSDGPLFCVLLRRLASDPARQDAFDPQKNPPPEDGYELETAAERLTELLKKPVPRKKSAARRTKKTSSTAAKKSGRTKRGAKSSRTTKRSRTASSR